MVDGRRSVKEKRDEEREQEKGRKMIEVGEGERKEEEGSEDVGRVK